MDAAPPRKRVKVLFFFLGIRRSQILKEVADGISPDTALRGLNYLQDDPMLEVEYVDAQDVPAWALQIVPFQLLPFVHLRRILRADVVIATDAVFLGYIASLAARLRFARVRWVYMAINSSVLMRRHEDHRVRLWLLKLFWRSYAKIFFIAESQKQDFLRLGISEDQLARIDFGVDVDYWTPKGPSKNGHFVTSVGRDLGRDYHSLFEGVEGLPYRIVIATAPKNIPAGIPIPANVEVRYNVPITGVKELYAEASIVVVILKEDGVKDGSDCTGQTVILEALAAGKAVIATKKAWLEEYLEDGKEYLSVPPYDPAAIFAAITRLMNDSSLRSALEIAGSARVKNSYSTRIFAQQLKDAIIGLVL